MKHIWHLMAAMIVAISLPLFAGQAIVSGADLISAGPNLTGPKLVFRKSTDIVSSGRPAFKYYTDRQGLPQNAISSIEMDRRGYLWIGTKDGAAYYNGRIWRTVNLPNRTKSNFVWIIRNAADGGMWFGTSGAGVLHLKDDRWTIYDQTTGLGDDIIHGMVETCSERGDTTELWVATNAGIGCLSGGRWRMYNARSGFPVQEARCLAVTETTSHQRIIWVGTEGSGFWKFEAGQWSQVPMPPGRKTWVRCLLATTWDGAPALWVGTIEGLFLYQSGRWLPVELTGGASNTYILSLLETVSPSGNRILWIGNYFGLVRLEQGEWTTYSIAKGGKIGTWSLFETKAEQGGNTLWIGTAGAGLVRWKQGTWASFDQSSGLVGNSTYSIFESQDIDKKPTFWIGTTQDDYGCYLSQFREGTWTQPKILPLDGGFGRTFLETTMKDGASSLWMGTNLNLARYQNGVWKEVTSGYVNALFAEAQPSGEPRLLAGLGRGLCQLVGTELVQIRMTPTDPQPAVTAFTTTPRPNGTHTLWVGTTQGLFGYEDGRWVQIGTESGLAGNQVLSLLATVEADGSRWLWVGTSNGLSWKNLSQPGDPWKTLSEASSPALPNNTVYRISQDHSRRLYLSTNKGVVRLTSKQLPTNLDTFDWYTFTVEDGLPSNECNTGASLVDSKGRLWVGTIAGAAVFDPGQERSQVQPDPLLIEQALVRKNDQPPARNTSQKQGTKEDFDTLDVSQSQIELPYNRNHLVFEFALLSFFREADTRFQTQLLGLDAGPSEWTSDFRKEYITLPGGSYVFRVWGKNASGQVTGPVEVAFRIHPAPWRTWWAYGGYALALGCFGWAGYRFRVRQLLAREQELSRQVAQQTTSLIEEKERTIRALAKIQILNEQLAEANAQLQDVNQQERERALRAISAAHQAQLLMLRYQINPHFLFNVLTTIWGLVDEDPVRTRQMVAGLSKFLRYSLNTANSTRVALVEELNSIRNYLEIQKIRFEDQIEMSYRIDPAAEPINVPPFLLQPLVENAIKYGMQTSPLPLKVHISAQYRGARLQLRVSNSGRWVELHEQDMRAGSTDIGLNNIRQRLQTAFPGKAELRVFHHAGWVWIRIRIEVG